MIVSTMAAALVGDLLILPAILAGPLGYYFAPGSPHQNSVELAKPARGAQNVEIAPRRRQDQLQGPAIVPKQTQTGQKTEFPVVSQPRVPLRASQQVSGEDGQKEVADGPHADLHARLRNLRRDSSQGYKPS